MSASISKAATPDSSVFAGGGEVGVLFYAMLLIIAWLLIRDFLKDRLIWHMVKASREADKLQADAINSLHATLTRVESAVGVREYQRMVEKGELPRGAIP